jgi:arylsulfatase A-like enzyme
LPEAAVPLAELLRQQGYSTAGFTTNGNVVSELGFGQGFDIYQYLAGRDENGRPLGMLHPRRSDALNTRALTWLAERPRDQPFFLYLHAMDPHYPYIPPPSVRARLAAGVDPSLGTEAMLAKLVFLQHVASDEELSGIVQLYDAQIAFNDRSFGILCRKLKWQGLFDDALIVLLADHGEEFLDHGGWEHGRSLYDEMLRVPLVIKWPGQRNGERVESPAQLVDILPTVLAVAGVDIPDGLDGHSLFPPSAPSDRALDPLFSSLDFEGNVIDGVQLGDLKLIVRSAQEGVRSYPDVELFDLASDPGERRNLVEARPVDAGYLGSLLNAARALPRGVPAKPRDLPDAVREQLRALGDGH